MAVATVISDVLTLLRDHNVCVGKVLPKSTTSVMVGDLFVYTHVQAHLILMSSRHHVAMLDVGTKPIEMR